MNPIQVFVHVILQGINIKGLIFPLGKFERAESYFEIQDYCETFLNQYLNPILKFCGVSEFFSETLNGGDI
jgi:hypothetical protein